MQLTDETRRRTEVQNGSSSGNDSASMPASLHHGDVGKRCRCETCNHCKKPGHVQDDCWAKHPEKSQSDSEEPVNGDSWGVRGRPLL